MSKLKVMSAAAICASTFLVGTSHAAVLNFDLSGVGTTAGNISGGFTFDTVLQEITSENATLSGVYTKANNGSVDTLSGSTTFTLRDEIELFSLTLALFGLMPTCRAFCRVVQQVLALLAKNPYLTRQS